MARLALVSLNSERLEMQAATAVLMRLELESLPQLSATLNAFIPDSWPPRLVGNLIGPFVIERLEDYPHLVGWSYWYWVFEDRATGRRILVGRSHFSAPACDGTVEIAYEVLEPFQGLGLGTEGVMTLAAWALSQQQVTRVVADAYSAASVRVLEKCGFRLIGRNSRMSMLRYEMVSSDSPSGPDPDQGEAEPGQGGRSRLILPWLKRWLRR